MNYTVLPMKIFKRPCILGKKLILRKKYLQWAEWDKRAPARAAAAAPAGGLPTDFKEVHGDLFKYKWLITKVYYN